LLQTLNVYLTYPPGIVDNELRIIGVYDPKDPFNDSARPNSWTPPLNTTWDWTTNHVYGVNLGGLFVLEPFISPALFQKYPTAVDEWTLSQAMAADTSSGGGLQSQLEAHYDTFIVSHITGLFFCTADLSLPSTHYRRGACQQLYLDGARHCRDCRGRVELDSLTYSILGD
jgi:hypothetical protein